MSKPVLLTLASTFPRFAEDDQPAFVLDLVRNMPDFHHVVLAPAAPGYAGPQALDGVEVIRYRYAPVSAWERLAYDGGMLANVRRMPWLLLCLPGFLLCQVYWVWRLCRTRDVSVIHAHWVIPQGFCAAIARLLLGRDAPPVLITSHGADAFALRSGPGRLVKRWTLHRVDALTGVSSAVTGHLEPICEPALHTEVLPMGVHLPPQVPADSVQRQGICFVGRLVEKKGVGELLDAYAQLRQSWPEAPILRIAGSGPDEQRLKARAHELGLGQYIEFLGWQQRDEVFRLLRRSACSVFPFRTAASGDAEGLGLVVVESLLSGTPVVTFAYDALADIQALTGGIVVAPKTAPAALATCIREGIQKGGSLRSQIDTEALLDVFSWDRVGARYTEILKSLT